MGAVMKSFDGNRGRYLDDLGVPADLQLTCCRMWVWRRPWGNTTIAWVDGQEPEKIQDLDWIEYVPGSVGPSLTDCPACCGISEDSCVWHGIP